MPELPEVNTFKRYFDESALQQKIVQTIVSDDKIIRNCSGAAFADLTEGRTFVQSYRRGKYLFGEMDNGAHILLHFGMTGDLKYYEDAEDQPKHERFRFEFDNGMKLGFDCPRKFARIVHVADLQEFIAEKNLGEDALVISENEFLARTKGKKSSIKGFLLNQNQVAGVGNLYADEICYQTRIHPSSRVNALSENQLKTIFKAMKSILKEAVEKRPYYKEYSGEWFWDKWRKEGMLKGKGMVVSAKIAGRTTYWVEGWQVLYN